jgi:hypothetical protein
MITDLRAELERSSTPSVNVADLETLKQKINRVYETLYDQYDWPFLRKIFDRIPMQQDERYYSVPTDLDFDRIEKVVCWQNNLQTPIDGGISIEDYAIYSSEDGDVADPVLKWDVRFDDVNDVEVIEVWPMPASNSNSIQFQGVIKFAPLVNDDDLCRLDDKVIILYAAAELVPEKSGKREILLAAAKDRLHRIKGRSKSASTNIRIGMGEGSSSQPDKAIIRIAG